MKFRIYGLLIIITITAIVYNLCIHHIFLIQNSQNYCIESIENRENNDFKLLNNWDLTGSPIFINDTDPLYNWSKTSNDNPWCTGSGTWNDPYIIANVTINGQNMSSCIEISNSNVFFKIVNCTLYNSIKGEAPSQEAAIKIFKSNNGIIMNNTCFSNPYAGIQLWDSENFTISRNTVFDNLYYGIMLDYHSESNKVINNTAINNLYGIYAVGGSDNSIISNNTLNDNYAGIAISNQKINASGNLMYNCGFLISELMNPTLNIDTTNKVNDKPVYYYGNKSGLVPANFSNAGQVFLIQCNHSIISNLELYSTTEGIKLISCLNITISNTIAENIKERGIALYECKNSTIFNNSANQNDYGISSSNGIGNNFSFNSAEGNKWAGISLGGSNYSLIYNNTIKNCDIYISWNSNFNNIFKNYVGSGKIWLYSWGGIPDNFKNNISSNLIDNGRILLQGADNNTISYNFVYNSQYGVCLSYSNYNVIIHNIFKVSIRCIEINENCIGTIEGNNTCEKGSTTHNPDNNGVISFGIYYLFPLFLYIIILIVMKKREIMRFNKDR